MSDNLPAVAGDPNNVLLAAIAKAAAVLAAQSAGDRSQAGPLDRAAIEAIAEECVREAFLRIHIDLTNDKSWQAFNTTIAHAERSRTMGEKVGSAVLTAVLTSVALAVVALVGKYGFGGPR